MKLQRQLFKKRYRCINSKSWVIHTYDTHSYKLILFQKCVNYNQKEKLSYNLSVLEIWILLWLTMMKWIFINGKKTRYMKIPWNGHAVDRYTHMRHDMTYRHIGSYRSSTPKNGKLTLLANMHFASLKEEEEYGFMHCSRQKTFQNSILVSWPYMTYAIAGM